MLQGRQPINPFVSADFPKRLWLYRRGLTKAHLADGLDATMTQQ
jgi:hypothetical protein